MVSSLKARIGTKQQPHGSMAIIFTYKLEEGERVNPISWPNDRDNRWEKTRKRDERKKSTRRRVKTVAWTCNCYWAAFRQMAERKIGQDWAWKNISWLLTVLELKNILVETGLSERRTGWIWYDWFRWGRLEALPFSLRLSFDVRVWDVVSQHMWDAKQNTPLLIAQSRWHLLKILAWEESWMSTDLTWWEVNVT